MCTKLRMILVAFAAVALIPVVGCSTGASGGVAANGEVPRGEVTVDFDLTQSGGLGTFEAQAGVPTDNRGTGSVTLGAPIGTGSLAIDPSDIIVTPAGAAKASTAMQADTTLIITAWIAGANESDTVCGGGEQYGPYTVVLDESYAPISVTPSSIVLTQNTVDLLNAGQFSLCIRVESPIDATVEILSLSFNLVG